MILLGEFEVRALDLAGLRVARHSEQLVVGPVQGGIELQDLSLQLDREVEPGVDVGFDPRTPAAGSLGFLIVASVSHFAVVGNDDEPFFDPRPELPIDLIRRESAHLQQELPRRMSVDSGQQKTLGRTHDSARGVPALREPRNALMVVFIRHQTLGSPRGSHRLLRLRLIG